MTLELRGVGKRVGGVWHLADIDLSLQPGLNVLLGRTLAGKTSLMRLMAGLDRPTNGTVHMDGTDVTGQGVRARNVAFVYQQFINYPAFTVFDNIAAPLRRQGVARKAIKEKVTETAKQLRIDHLLQRLPGALSGGQQQRTALARALVKDARLLLLDEPLVNLDYKLREELREELRAIFRRSDTIVVYATTEPHEALLLSGQTAVLHEGRLLQAGPTLGVFQQPNSLTVGELFSDPPMNTADARLRGGQLLLGELTMPRPAHLHGIEDGAYKIGVRPHHLAVEAQSPEAVAIPGEVDLTEVSGSETFLHIVRDQLHWVVLEDGVHVQHIGDAVTVYLDPKRVFLFTQDGALLRAPSAPLPQAA